MEMLATLVLFVLVALLLFNIFEGYNKGEIAFGNAYPLTQKIVTTINMLSASPQNESAIITIKPFKFKLTFDTQNNYVESYVSFIGESEYGLFVFPDVHLIANDIDCLTTDCTDKKILINKEVYGDEIYVTVGEVGASPPISTTTTTVMDCTGCICLPMGPCLIDCGIACCPGCSGICCK